MDDGSSRTPAARGGPAGGCDRLPLSSPNVGFALPAPRRRADLEESLEPRARGPLSTDEPQRMRAFGEAVHG